MEAHTSIMQMNWNAVTGAVAVYGALLSTWNAAAKHLAGKWRIKGSIDKIYVTAYSPENLQGCTRCDAKVFVKAVLRNESERQTTIQSFGLTIQDAEGIHASEYLGEADDWFILHEPGMQDSCGGVSGRKTERLTDLGADTAKNPVVRGIPREGWLRFKVADINPQSAEKGLYCLTATDPSGVSHKVCRRENPQRGSGQLLPQRTQPVPN